LEWTPIFLLHAFMNIRTAILPMDMFGWIVKTEWDIGKVLEFYKGKKRNAGKAARRGRA
jgi:hypothetical protein